ncbi:MAG: hypothetical protein ACYST6_21325 [Planctomycetota bacterium]|jgi:hypothetical protein
MDWLIENGPKIGVGIGAVLGAIYFAARVYAALTPTPKDDEAIKKVGILLKGIWKLLGIDIKQGRKQ